MKRAGGFTLIELMIVIAIVAVLAGIALPNLIEARKQTNETAAIGALKSIAGAQAIFREGDKDDNGEKDFGTMAALSVADVLDQVLTTGTRSGFLFTVGPAANGGGALFYSYANPQLLGGSADRSFVSNQAGVVYYTQNSNISGGLLGPGGLEDDAVIPPGVIVVGGGL